MNRNRLKFDTLNILIAISHNNPLDTHNVMTPAQALKPWRVKQALTLIILLLLTPLSLTIKDFETMDLVSKEEPSFTSASPWNPQTQPWAQYSGVPTHNGSMPPHGPEGGPGSGSVEDVIQFGVIDSPTVNWVASDDFDGADSYGSIIGNFSASVTTTPGSVERCGLGELFGIIITSESGLSTLSIITGDEAKIAWQVELGQTNPIRSTPMITDIDSDGKQEIIVVYDTASSLEIEVWSPDYPALNQDGSNQDMKMKRFGRLVNLITQSVLIVHTFLPHKVITCQ